MPNQTPRSDGYVVAGLGPYVDRRAVATYIIEQFVTAGGRK